jgi:hypothetical protein
MAGCRERHAADCSTLTVTPIPRPGTCHFEEQIAPHTWVCRVDLRAKVGAAAMNLPFFCLWSCCGSQISLIGGQRSLCKPCASEKERVHPVSGRFQPARGVIIHPSFPLRGRWERLASVGEQAPSPSLAFFRKNVTWNAPVPLYCKRRAQSRCLSA